MFTFFKLHTCLQHDAMQHVSSMWIYVNRSLIHVSSMWADVWCHTTAGVGVGSSVYISNAKKKQCRFFRTPSHYVCKDALGWLWLMVMFITRRMQKKTWCLHFLGAFASMPPHCTVHMLGSFIAFLSYMKLNVFGDCPMVFQGLPHFTVSKPSTKQEFRGIPSINLRWSDTHVVRSCESHNFTAP